MQGVGPGPAERRPSAAAALGIADDRGTEVGEGAGQGVPVAGDAGPAGDVSGSAARFEDEPGPSAWLSHLRHVRNQYRCRANAGAGGEDVCQNSLLFLRSCFGGWAQVYVWAN